jgi:hypothetical protein
MLRKSLILGSITLLLVMLFALTGCEGPVGPAGSDGTDGRNGIPGAEGDTGIPGNSTLGGRSVVTDKELIIAFDQGNPVILESSVISVYGEVPAGKTLIVLGEQTAVADGEKLTVKGTLDISNTKGTSTLNASGIPGAIGVLVSDGGASLIKGTGAVVLPYVVDASTYTDGLEYDSPAVQSVTRYPGSIVRNNDDPVLLDSSGIRTILTKEGIEDLTVLNIPNLAASAIPAGKKLTLKGLDNTVTSGFVLKDGASLTIAEGAVLRTFGSAGVGSLSTSDAEIINKGTIELGNAGSARKGITGKFVNDGLIKSSVVSAITGPNIIEGLLAMEGTGKIMLNPALTTDEAIPLTQSVKLLLNQDLVIEPSLFNPNANPLPEYVYNIVFPNQNPPLDTDSAEGKTITLANSHSRLTFGNMPESIGIKVLNEGSISTATTSDEYLSNFFVDTDNAGKIIAAGSIVELSQVLDIPPGIELIISNSSTTFRGIVGGAAGYLINVEGSLFIEESADPLEPAGDVTVAGTLKIGNNQVFSPGGDVTITGILDLSTGTTPQQGGTLSIATGKTLSLSSTSVLEKSPIYPYPQVTGLIKIATNDGLTIDGIEDYGIATLAGVSGGNFAKALKAVHDSADLLRSSLITLPAGSPFKNTAEFPVIGTVEILAPFPNSYRIDNDDYADLDALKVIAVPTGTTVYTATSMDKGVPVTPTPIGSGLGNAEYFGIVITNGAVSVYEEPLHFGNLDEFGIVSFDKIRFVNSNLIGPIRPTTPAPEPGSGPWVDTFSVGIKTKR